LRAAERAYRINLINNNTKTQTLEVRQLQSRSQHLRSFPFSTITRLNQSFIYICFPSPLSPSLEVVVVPLVKRGLVFLALGSGSGFGFVPVQGPPSLSFGVVIDQVDPVGSFSCPQTPSSLILPANPCCIRNNQVFEWSAMTKTYPQYSLI